MTWTKILWWAATGCYLLAQALPGLWFVRGGKLEPWPGFGLSFSGLFAFMVGWQYFIPWLANPAFTLGWALVGYRLFIASDQTIPLWYIIWPLLALPLALSSLRLKVILVDEAGNTAAVQSLGSGFYVWLLSMLLLVVAIVLGYIRTQ